ncbi:MAG: phosphonoacetaldehyde hydrolase [Synergistaceae bacterium]|jgi:phosphonoacetaldehyde hydrolase|nr:phosphonoacetaldehyde hydrolase [Synergistaceae bacterium]
MCVKIEAVIFDWAGTTVDYGCFAPLNAFIEAFSGVGVVPTLEETRAPMGVPKRDHIVEMLRGERLRGEFVKRNGREPGQSDIDEIYDKFEPVLFDLLTSHAGLLPGVTDCAEFLRRIGIAIGSTTGYTTEMMEVLMPIASKSGYSPDSMVCPDDVEKMGRPYPYMLWKNLQILKISDIRRVIKVGDTASDIAEGKNAGCFTVGVLEGSSMLGLSLEEVKEISEEELNSKKEIAAGKYRNAGADAILNDISRLPDLIK